MNKRKYIYKCSSVSDYAKLLGGIQSAVTTEFRVSCINGKLAPLHGIEARDKRRYKACTDSKHSLPMAANLLQRNFSPSVPDCVRQ
jgi:hypothetical protein